jgi:beta-glucosidase
MKSTIVAAMLAATACTFTAAAASSAAAAASAAAATAVLQQKPLWLDPTQPVEARLDALLPTLTTEQLAAQTLHLWFTQTMPDLMAKYNQTGVGASYILKPTANGTCNADPACNLAARNAANQQLMAGVGIPVTFVSETLHSPWVGQGVVMPMPVTMGATWNASLLTEVGKAIAAEATACGITRGFSPEINVCTDPRFGAPH